jgi:hypothetical protein
MRAAVTSGALLLFCATLAGCQIGGSPGVLPRTAVPPPPSMAGTSPDKSQTATARPIPSGAQAPGAPDPEERSASEPMIQPLLTGRGAGAGFRFRGPHSVNGVLTRAGRDGVTGRVALSPRRCGASSSASALAEIRDKAPAGVFLLGQGMPT